VSNFLQNIQAGVCKDWQKGRGYIPLFKTIIAYNIIPPVEQLLSGNGFAYKQKHLLSLKYK